MRYRPDIQSLAVPKMPTRAVPKSEPQAKRETVILSNAETRTFDFITPAKSEKPGAVSTLTIYDLGLLAERGHKNPERNAAAKRIWAAGSTAQEGAELLGVSLDLAKKLFGTFSTALSNQQADAE